MNMHEILEDVSNLLKTKFDKLSKDIPDQERLTMALSVTARLSAIYIKAYAEIANISDDKALTSYIMDISTNIWHDRNNN